MSAGDFSNGARFKSAVKEFLKYNSIFLGVGSIFITVVSVKNGLDAAGLKTVLVGTTNTLGLFAVILLLGHGLVDLPRYWLRNFSHKIQLRSLQFQIAALSHEMHDAEEAVDECVAQVADMRGQIGKNDPLRQYLTLISDRCPTLARDSTYQDMQKDDDQGISLQTLANLNKKLYQVQQVEQRTWYPY